MLRPFEVTVFGPYPLDICLRSRCSVWVGLLAFRQTALLRRRYGAT